MATISAGQVQAFLQQNPEIAMQLQAALDSGQSPSGPSLSDLFGAGKQIFKSVAPETYGSLTEGLPSMSDLVGGASDFLFGGGGADAVAPAFMDSAAFGGGALPDAAGMAFMDSPAFGGGALAAEGAGAAGGGLLGAAGGLLTAMGYAAPAALIAMALSMIPNTDGSVTQGQGIGDLAAGKFTAKTGGKKIGEANDLFTQLLGDAAWHEGGDLSKVSDKVIDVGSMSRHDDVPYYSIGGVPYESKDLAVASGRQIARGEMGMPVEYEKLVNAYAPGQQAALAAQMQNRDLPVYDAERNLPEMWDQMLDIRNQLGTGEGQNPSDVRLDAFTAGLTPRQREWFNQGMQRHQLFAFTGAETSPDAKPIAKNEFPMPGTPSTPIPMPTTPSVDPVQASLDANAAATKALPQKFTPGQMQKWLTYGQGPEALLGKPLDIAKILGG